MANNSFCNRKHIVIIIICDHWSHIQSAPSLSYFIAFCAHIVNKRFDIHHYTKYMYTRNSSLFVVQINKFFMTTPRRTHIRGALVGRARISKRRKLHRRHPGRSEPRVHHACVQNAYAHASTLSNIIICARATITAARGVPI